MAKAAESSERYSDMCKWVIALVDARLAEKKDLSEEERNLLSVGLCIVGTICMQLRYLFAVILRYKHVVGSRRSSFRCFQQGENKENGLIVSYKDIVKTEVAMTNSRKKFLIEGKSTGDEHLQGSSWSPCGQVDPKCPGACKGNPGRGTGL